MLVMVANNLGKEAKRLLAQFPDRIGHIYAPGGFKTPWPHYALDNGAYADYSKGKPFSADKFRKLCASAKAADHPPRWVAVPDVVTDRDATLERYHEWFAEPPSIWLAAGFCGARWDDRQRCARIRIGSVRGRLNGMEATNRRLLVPTLSARPRWPRQR